MSYRQTQEEYETQPPEELSLKMKVWYSSVIIEDAMYKQRFALCDLHHFINKFNTFYEHTHLGSVYIHIICIYIYIYAVAKGLGKLSILLAPLNNSCTYKI